MRFTFVASLLVFILREGSKQTCRGWRKENETAESQGKSIGRVPTEHLKLVESCRMFIILTNLDQSYSM